MTSNGNPSNYTTINHLPDDEKFDGENWVSWEESITRLGTRKGLQLYWKGDIVIPQHVEAGQIPNSTPVNDRNPNYFEYEIRENVAISTLLENIKNPSALGFDTKGKTSKDLWGWLKEEFESVSQLTRKFKEERLRVFKYESVGGTVIGEGSYTERWKRLWKEAKDAGVTISEEQAVVIYIDSFPSQICRFGYNRLRSSGSVITNRNGYNDCEI
ncbi:hypothetical protein VKT23_002767 [Stygiomarasmius scandens]|uniref:Retrotransposon Copia-like N-terminal domain-containing protein n=1 Tax=Marasmiellus scandens TaxID=2682957 RepID=A0ABR1JZL6_9AGAR